MDKRVEIHVQDNDGVKAIRLVFFVDGEITEIVESEAQQKTPRGLSKVRDWLLNDEPRP